MGEDALVCIDDSIVRGTTLKKHFTNSWTLQAYKIAHRIDRTPDTISDCYGIDMSELGKFIAFQAAVALIKAWVRRSSRGAIKCREALKIPSQSSRTM